MQFTEHFESNRVAYTYFIQLTYFVMTLLNFTDCLLPPLPNLLYFLVKKKILKTVGQYFNTSHHVM